MERRNRINKFMGFLALVRAMIMGYLNINACRYMFDSFRCGRYDIFLASMVIVALLSTYVFLDLFVAIPLLIFKPKDPKK